jgi:hypothetical protein
MEERRDMNESSESTRKKLELLDQRLREKSTLVLKILDANTKLLDHIEKHGMLPPEIIEQRRRLNSELKKEHMNIMNNDELRYFFEMKYR